MSASSPSVALWQRTRPRPPRDPAGHDAARTWLVGILAAGAVLRLLFMIAWEPAFMGWPDAKTYLLSAHGQVFASVLRPAGYPIFLRLLDIVVPSFSVIIVVNHLLGLGAAALLFFAVRRAGGPAALGLVPAAVVALGGDGVFLEHSPLSEPLFIFLVSLGLWCAARSLDRGRWAAAAGAALALAATVRVVGLVLLPVLAVWLLAGMGGGWRRRALAVVVGLVGAGAVVGAYYGAEDVAIGQTGLSRAGAWHLYGRVAPFADCSKFTPPPGTQQLCEATPRARRPYTDDYIFNWWYSPAIRAFGGPGLATAAGTAAVRSFAIAVIEHQPMEYVGEVTAGMLRYVAPSSFRGAGGGPSYADFLDNLFSPPIGQDGLNTIRRYYGWGPRTFQVHQVVLDALRDWEAATRLQGPVMALLMLLSLAAPFVTTGRARRMAGLLTLSAWALLVAPVASLEFSARTAVPGFGALAGAAALGGWGCAAFVRARLPATRRAATRRV
ncbi:MAG TPA: hypothetical protein VGI54_07750 [Solirubrobacteraceae bacterium]